MNERSLCAMGLRDMFVQLFIVVLAICLTRVFEARYLFTDPEKRAYEFLLVVMVTLALCAINFYLIFLMYQCNNTGIIMLPLWLGLIFMPVFINNLLDSIHRVVLTNGHLQKYQIALLVLYSCLFIHFYLCVMLDKLKCKVSQKQ